MILLCRSGFFPLSLSISLMSLFFLRSDAVVRGGGRNG